ncbi:MAG: 3-methyl-2-oxobutanoate hydroxymethyltransferase, partial [Acidimicrobiia bacterium]
MTGVAAPVRWAHRRQPQTIGSQALDGKEGERHAHRVPAADRPQVRAHKVRDGREPLVMVTAYDAPGARAAHAADVDLVLVGDS